MRRLRRASRPTVALLTGVGALAAIYGGIVLLIVR